MTDRAEDTEADRPAPLEMTPEEFTRLGYRLVDRIAELLGSLRERRVAPDTTPAELRAILGQGGLPEAGDDPARIVDDAVGLLFPWSRLNAHPRHWAYIGGSPAPICALADLLAAALDQNVVMWNSGPMAAEIELQTVRWIAELVGYPEDCGGLLVSGGNMANYIGLLVGRRVRAGGELRAQGVARAPGALRVYATEEAHTWLHKAVDMFGLGTEAIRWVEVDAQQRMRPADLEARVRADRAAGDLPFLVVGTAGTVSTGAIDPLAEIAAIARAHELWFHVDGAYGAFAAALPDAPGELAALAAADSLALDPHKWLYTSFEAGCALVRDRQALLDTFSFRPPYYHLDYARGEEPTHFYEYGPQNTRAFRALKVWMALRQAGREGYRTMIARDVALARALFRRAEAAPDFEAETCALSIATFRYVPPDLERGRAGAEDYLSELNRRLLTRVQKSGEAYVSNAVIDGRYLLRACFVNFRAELRDIDAALEVIRRLGAALDREIRPADLRASA